MADKMLIFQLVTPDKLLLEEEVDEVIACGEDGYFGVLQGHAPMIRTLGVGVLTYRTGASSAKAVVIGGFIHVKDDAKKRAEELLARRDAEVDFTCAERALHRAVTRLEVSSPGR